MRGTSGDLRHPRQSRYRCSLPGLAGFAGPRCTEPEVPRSGSRAPRAAAEFEFNTQKFESRHVGISPQRDAALTNAASCCGFYVFLREVFPSLLVLRIVGVGFYFQDLLGVAFAVRGDQQDEFVAVQFCAHRAIDGVIAQTRRGLHEILGFGAAFDEVFQGTVGRAEAIRGNQRFRCLGFLRAVWDHGHHAIVNFLCVAAGDSRGHHYFFRVHAANVVFGGGEVLNALRDGPTIWSGFEIPLRFRETFGGIQDALLRFLEILDRAILFRLG